MSEFSGHVRSLGNCLDLSYETCLFRVGCLLIV